MNDHFEKPDELRRENAELRKQLRMAKRALKQAERVAKRSESMALQSKSAMLRTYDELEHRVDELRAAKLVAEGTASNKERFLATMSHELRTPLNGMVGSAELLLTTPLAATNTWCLEQSSTRIWSSTVRRSRRTRRLASPCR